MVEHRMPNRVAKNCFWCSLVMGSGLFILSSFAMKSVPVSARIITPMGEEASIFMVAWSSVLMVTLLLLTKARMRSRRRVMKVAVMMKLQKKLCDRA